MLKNRLKSVNAKKVDEFIKGYLKRQKKKFFN